MDATINHPGIYPIYYEAFVVLYDGKHDDKTHNAYLVGLSGKPKGIEYLVSAAPPGPGGLFHCALPVVVS